MNKDISDAVLFFNTINLDGRKREQSILSYIDCKTVIDRFGFKLYSSYLSVGCKAALCVFGKEQYMVSYQTISLHW